MKKIFDDKFGKIAIYAVSCVAVTALFLSIWLNLGTVADFLKSAVRVFSPLLYAVVAVLIINPSVHLFHDRVFAFIDKNKKKPHPKLRRALSVIAGYLLFTVLLLAVVVIVFVPFAENIGEIQTMVPDAIRSTVRWIETTISNYEFLAPQKDVIMERIEGLLIFSPELIQSIIGTVVSYASGVVAETFNVLIGVIISVYIIVSMDYLKSLRDKIMDAFFSKEKTVAISKAARGIYRVFSDYFIGRLMYSITIGIVFFYVLYLFKVPFYSVISIAMGMIAFVPVCGTVLSYAVGICLCLLFDPQDAGWCMLIFFAVFLLGRVFLQPHLIKETVTADVGLCILSVIIMYALFNVVGAMLAVPTFIVLREWILAAAEKRKQKAVSVSEK